MPGVRARALLIGAVGFVVGACFIFHEVRVEPVTAASPVAVSVPVKAHLKDGATVVFPGGVSIAGDQVLGNGTRYDLKLRPVGDVAALPLDSVAGMEAFRDYVRPVETVVVSTLATGATVFGGALLAIAIFGSCPTVYADSAGTRLLQAETFSYSIAPLFEVRDVDRLRLTPTADGMVRLDVRNEAAETHYLNELTLLEVRHGTGELALPDAAGDPLAVTRLAAPARGRDRMGRDVRPALRSGDERAYRTAAGVLAGVGPGDVLDWIDLEFRRPAGVDSAALVLRLRNSLLNTVLLYDQMLGRRGPRALEWLGRDLERVGPALELGQWYAGRMGLGVAVWEDGRYREVARVRDAGPIAWREVAAVIPLSGAATTDRVRVRLTFVADNWRIDRVALAAGMRRPVARAIAAARVLDAAGGTDDTARANLVDADRRYLATTPGQRFDVWFEAGSAPPVGARTFLLRSQGYYIEWIRPSWIASGRDTTAFRPTEAALIEALRRWRTAQDTFERRFLATRIPTR